MTGAEDARNEAEALEERSLRAALAEGYLAALLKQYPQYPTVALWRCWELALLTGCELQPPLLDLGCGDGRILAHLLAHDETKARPQPIWGLDINAQSVALAAHQGLYDGLVVADARMMPFGAQCLGSVLSVCVLEHIPHVPSVIADVARVLRPGGVLAFSVPTVHLLIVGRRVHGRDPEAWAAAFCSRVEHVNNWDVNCWVEALERAGLAVCVVRGFMPEDAAQAWFATYDWVVRPIRGRGALYRAAGPGLRRFGLGRLLAAYWYRRLRPWARQGVVAPLHEACAVLIVAQRPAQAAGITASE